MTADIPGAAAPARLARSLATVASFLRAEPDRVPSSGYRGTAEPSTKTGEAASNPIKLGSAGELE